MSPNTVPTAQPEVRVRRASLASWSVSRLGADHHDAEILVEVHARHHVALAQHPLEAQEPQRQPARMVAERHRGDDLARVEEDRQRPLLDHGDLDLRAGVIAPRDGARQPRRVRVGDDERGVGAIVSGQVGLPRARMLNLGTNLRRLQGRPRSEPVGRVVVAVEACAHAGAGRPRPARRAAGARCAARPRSPAPGSGHPRWRRRSGPWRRGRRARTSRRAASAVSALTGTACSMVLWVCRGVVVDAGAPERGREAVEHVVALGHGAAVVEGAGWGRTPPAGRHRRRARCGRRRRRGSRPR